jgi:hypothetical protein
MDDVNALAKLDAFDRAVEGFGQPRLYPHQS